MKHYATVFSTLAFIGLVAGCAATSKSSAPKPVENVTLTATVPALEPLEGYPWEQTKDAVTVTLTPEPFIHKIMYERSLVEKFEMIKVNQSTKYEVTERPHAIVVKPDRLFLHLHAVNNLSHVLRFHGCVISLQADGKNLPVDPQTVEEFTKAVLTPYASFDATLNGPETKQLAGVNTITFAIYDVITAVDAANNPTKRTTFEWIFSVRPQNVRDALPVKVREERLSPLQVGKLEKHFIAE
jgi:hypothetical protein